MKRTYFIIYLALFLAVLQAGCDKSGNMDAKSTTSGAGGSLARFAIVGNYLYVVDYSMLTAIDITDVTKPQKKGDAMHIGAGDIETIFPYKDKLFIGGQQGMYIFSITDPAKPKKEGSITHFRACDPVVSNDTVSYVTLRAFGTSCGTAPRSVLNVYDVKTLSNPRLVTTIDLKSPYGLGLRDKTLYVCEGANGLTVFDLSDPYKPAKKKDITGETFTDVIPYGNVLIAYINGGVSFYDISNPQNPVFMSKVKG